MLLVPTQLVNQIISPGFLSRRHCITRIKDHPLQKLDTVYAQPPLSSGGPEDPNDSIMWLWSRQDTERNYSTTDVKRGTLCMSYTTIHDSTFMVKLNCKK